MGLQLVLGIIIIVAEAAYKINQLVEENKNNDESK